MQQRKYGFKQPVAVKGILSKLLLVIYLSGICQSYVPYIRDAAAHIFWLHEHLELVHHQHGTDHVHIEFKEASEMTSPQEESRAAASDSLFTHFLPAQEVIIAGCGTTLMHSFEEYFLLPVELNILSPPPEAFYC